VRGGTSFWAAIELPAFPLRSEGVLQPLTNSSARLVKLFSRRNCILVENLRAQTGESSMMPDSEKSARKAEKKAKKKANKQADERQRMMAARRRRK
jgi:hypothetical protein